MPQRQEADNTRARDPSEATDMISVLKMARTVKICLGFKRKCLYIALVVEDLKWTSSFMRRCVIIEDHREMSNSVQLDEVGVSVILCNKRLGNFYQSKRYLSPICLRVFISIHR